MMWAESKTGNKVGEFRRMYAIQNPIPRKVSLEYSRRNHEMFLVYCNMELKCPTTIAFLRELHLDKIWIIWNEVCECRQT